MRELFFGPVAIYFGIPATIGTAFFSLRLIMMLVGGDTDVDGGGDIDVGDADGSDGDSTETFRILSIQTVSSFLMGFGWGGLGALKGGGWPVALSVAFATLSGLAMIWLLARLLRFVYGLQSDGTLPLFHALESQGTVYASVPGENAGAGEVRLVIRDRERYYKAITEGEQLPRGTRIRVVGIDEENSLVKIVEA